jgi:hypothetical protein
VTSWTAVPDTGWSVIGGSSQGAVLRTGFQHGSAVVDVHVGCGSSGAPTFEVEGPAARGLGTG